MIVDDDISYRISGMRTLVDIPKLDVMALDALGRKRGESRAKIIREAVVEYLERRTEVPRAEAFGLWKPNDEDGLAYQMRMRAEW